MTKKLLILLIFLTLIIPANGWMSVYRAIPPPAITNYTTLNTGGLLVSNLTVLNWINFNGTTIYDWYDLLVNDSNFTVPTLQSVTDKGDTTTHDIGLINNDPFGVSTLDIINSDGGKSSLFRLGQSIPSTGKGKGGNTTGLVNYQGDLYLATSNNDSILIGSFPGNQTNLAEFTVEIDPALRAIVLQGSKYIRTVAVDGGDGLLFQSTDVLVAGGFPFIWVAQDSSNETIVTNWQQTGRNNSFSGQMNSFGVVTKSWVNFVGEPLSQDMEGVEFLFNASNYIKYCQYLQENKSLLPEGCKYFADTTGRIVPLLFAGDLEVHRSATIHEGATVFHDFDFIGRDGNDVDFLFNGDFNNGKMHITDLRQISSNVTAVDRVIANFDDGTLLQFIDEGILDFQDRVWQSVLSPICFSSRCGRALGGSVKTMSYSAPTYFPVQGVNVSAINMSFYLTTVISGADFFTVRFDDNQGNVSDVFTQAISTTNLLVNLTYPAIYLNKDNVTVRFIFSGQNNNREVYVDEVTQSIDIDGSLFYNETYNGGFLMLGEDRGGLSCSIDTEKVLDEITFDTQWNMNLGCENQRTTIKGNTFVEGNLNVSGIVQGNLEVEGCIIYNGGTLGTCV